MAKSDIQGFKDSHARLVGTEADKLPKRPDHHWWEYKDATPAFECLEKHAEEYGEQNVRLAVREGLSADGASWEAWLVVSVRKTDPTTGKARWTIVGAFNVSHPCPPDCGPGDDEE